MPPKRQKRARDTEASKTGTQSSQRKTARKAAPRSKLASTRDNTASTSFFEQVLADNHVVIPVLDGDLPAMERIVIQDPHALQNALNKGVADNIDVFIEGFEHFIGNRLGLHAALAPASCNGQPCDSLVRNLLGVPCIQPKLLDILLQKLPEHIDDDSQSINNNLPKLIIASFKWLDVVVDDASLCNNFFEAASLCPSEHKRELLNAVPEIIPDAQHAIAAEKLITMMDEDVELVAPVLDCLGSLTLSTAVLEDIRTSVLSKLQSTTAKDLPVAVKFLVQSCSTIDAATEVVKGIRTKLDFISRPIDSPEKKHSTRTDEAMILDALRAGLRMEPLIAKVYLKEVDKNVIQASEFRPMDLWMLLSMCANATMKKQAHIVLRRKASMGVLSTRGIMSAIVGHPDGLIELYPYIVGLAGSCLRKGDDAIASFGRTLYISAFQTFSNSGARRGIVVDLVAHVGAGREWEASSALTVLAELEPDQLRAYAPFVKGMMDFLGHLSDNLVRKALAVILILSDSDDGMGTNDVLIYIQKLVTSLDSSYRRVGLLGVGAVASKLSTRPDSSVVKWAHDMLGDLLDYHSGDASARAFLLDELDRAIGTSQVDRVLVDRVHEHIRVTVEETHLVDIDGGVLQHIDTKCEPLKPVAWGNLDGDLAVVAANLLPHSKEVSAGGVLSWRSAVIGGASGRIIPMLYGLHLQASALRLLIRTERVTSGNLENIDALLGCPLSLFESCIGPPTTSFNYLPLHLKDHTCVVLARGINWLRECLNGYSSDAGKDMQFKIIMRMHQLDALEGNLEKRLEEHPNFVASLLGEKEGSSRKRGDESDDESSRAKPRSSKVTDTWSRIRMDKARAKLLRPLQPHTFAAILAYDIDITSSSISAVGISTLVPSLLPEGLHFLLGDLLSSLHGLLTGSSSAIWLKRRQPPIFLPFDDTRAPIDVLSDLSSVIAAIAGRIAPLSEALAARARLTASPTESDSPSVIGAEEDTVREEMGVLASCLVMALQCLECVFSYRDLHSNTASHVLTMLLRGLVTDECGDALYDLRVGAHHTAVSWIPLVTDGVYGWPAAAGVALCGLIDGLLGGSKWGNSVVWSVCSCSMEDEDEKMREELSKLAMVFLSNRWSSDLTTEHISSLVHHVIASAKAPITQSGKLIETIIKAVPRGDEVVAWPSLTKGTFPKHFRIVSGEVGHAIVSVLGRHARLKGSCEPHVITDIDEAIRAAVGIFTITKTIDQKVILSACMKLGKQFLDAFLKTMHVLSANFRENQKSILVMLKTLQPGTRILHNLCAHAKVTEDANLMRVTPTVKKQLEMMIYKVKALLDTNKCVTAFWIGNLRHRALDGQEVSSQLEEAEEEVVEEEEEREEEGEEEEESLK